MRDGFTFGDRSTWDFHMHVEKYPTIGGAKRRVTKTPVPGRNGCLHIDEGVYESYTQKYECYFHSPDTAAKQAHAIQQWLLGGGLRRLVDVYDPEHYHPAFFTGPLDVANILNKYGRCVLSFDVDPRAFLISSENPIPLTKAGTITNLTAYRAQPLIHVKLSGAGMLYVGNRVVIFGADPGTGELWLDCESMEAYTDSGSCNSYVSCIDYPVLEPGETPISWAGGVTSVEVIPRWWEL